MSTYAFAACVGTIVILYGIIRLVTWLVCWALWKSFKVHVSVASIGIFTVGGVHLRLGERLSLEIEKLWLSSSYINSEIQKPLCVCVGDTRLQINLPEHSGGDGSLPGCNTTQTAASKGIVNRWAPRLLSLLQFVAFQLSTLHIFVLKGLLQDSMIDISIQEVRLYWSLQQRSLNMAAGAKQITAKVLRSSSQDSSIQPCLAELSLCVSVSVLLDIMGLLPPEVLKLKVGNVQAMIAEGLVLQIQKLRKQNENSRRSSSPQPSAYPGSVEYLQHQQSAKVPKILTVLPKEADVEIENVCAALCRETANRKLSATLKRALLKWKQGPNILTNCHCTMVLEDFQAHSPQAHISSLNKLEADFTMLENSVSIETRLTSMFLGYHHEEINYWLGVIARLRAEHKRPKRIIVTNEEDVEPASSPFATAMKQKTFTLLIAMNGSSMAVAIASCSGVKGGMLEGKFSLTVRPGHAGGQGDMRAEVEMTGLYCKLAEGGPPAAELTAKYHHWNTLCYVAIVIGKMNKMSDSLQLELLVDRVQLEWSTAAMMVISQILNVVLKTRHASGTQHTDHVTDHAYANHLGSGDVAQADGNDEGSLGGLLKEAIVNIKVTNINIFATNDVKACVMLRLDSCSITQRTGKADMTLDGTKLVYFIQKNKFCSLDKSADIQSYTGHFKGIHVTFSITNKIVTLKVTEECYLRWATCVHLTLYTAFKDAMDLISKLPARRRPSIPIMHRSSKPSSSFSAMITVSANAIVILLLSKAHRVTFSSPGLNVNVNQGQTMLKTAELTVTCDKHDVFRIQEFELCLQKRNVEMKAQRELLDQLSQSSNRCLSVQCETLNMLFPYEYNFSACLEEVINMNKWIKLVHKRQKKPFTVDSPLPPDVVIKVKTTHIQINDDPFEVRLGDNYELQADEFQESNKRHSAMDKRIAEIRQQVGLLHDGKVQELYGQLTKKNAEVYIHRSRQLYISAPIRSKLFTWRMENLEIKALADKSFHGKENVIRHMREIDKDSPYPETGLEFSSLFCRYVMLDLKSLVLQLRDYPQHMLDIADLHVWGRFIGAESEPADRARRACTVEVSEPWGDYKVHRSMPPLKFYHDFSCDVTHWIMAYGACWEPANAQFNLAQNLINKPSADPSTLLPFWDKFRLLLHGRLTMAVRRMTWLYHASLDPYNTSELMDWTWSDLLLDWTNAKWVFEGDLDIYSKTASKYDDCRLLHLPKLRLCIKLNWVCLGDPDDHHSVMPCAPDKVPEYSVQDHDSYRAFRTQHLNVNLSFETKPSNESNPHDIPTCVFYANTLKWVDKVKNCMARVSRPIRRGRYFNNLVPQKPLLSRHYRDINISVKLHQFQVCYWVSFARQHGMEMVGDAFQLSIGPQLSLVPYEDEGLFRRSQANWTIQHFQCELTNATIWLCSSKQLEDANLSVKDPVNKSFFLNVQRLSYQRHEPDEDFTEAADMKSVESEPEKPKHKMQIYSLKGSWTPSNRNVGMSLYDGYKKAQSLRKNLASNALQGFKVDSTAAQSSAKLSRSASLSPGIMNMQNTPSPMAKLQSGPAFTMLKKLITEHDSSFVAVHEEVSGGDVQVEQLHGVVACQTDDVIAKNWHIEVYNSQMMLKGCDSAGYVLVTSAKTSIISCEHQPIWKDRQLKTKNTWFGSLECMQYYGTVDAPENLEASQDNIMWVSKENIESRDLPSVGMTEMVGTGHTVGGIISSAVGATAQTIEDKQVQLQRIISRCKCQFFYASFGEADPNTVPEVPPLLETNDDSDMMKREEGVDAFTLVHHDLNICTNSKQFSIILDIVNNLLLYVESKQKDLNDKLQDMRFKLQLASSEDQRPSILNTQNKIRDIMVRIKQVERGIYLVRAQLEQSSDFGLEEQMNDLTRQLNYYKGELNSEGEKLNIMISCFKERQLQTKAQLKATKSKQSRVEKINEVCFKHAEWRLTDVDGQLGISDLVMRNFLYSKVNKDDDSGSHLLELGWVKVTNLLPDTIYREVVAPQGAAPSEKQAMLRILCKFRAPVGGISVKEHLEMNLSPVTIQITHQFYRTLMQFFFPEKNKENEGTGDDNLGGSRLDLTGGASMKRRGSSRQRPASVSSEGDIDKMKNRAAQNQTFIYVKVPETPLKFSYKGEKEKNIQDLHDVSLVLPTLEYHNKSWRWLDLLMAMKNDSKKDVIAQAIKQKLHVKSRNFPESLTSGIQEEEDKAKMLLGAKLFAGLEKPSKKSLFGKGNKS